MTQIDFNCQVQNQYQPLKGYAIRLTQNTEEAEDLVHDTMLKAFINKDKFQEGTNLKGWLHTIMKNVFINKYRRMKKSNIQSDDTENQFYINNASIAANNNALSSLALKDITNAISQLKDNLKTPFMMSYTGFKYEEIAQQLSIPLGTVKIRIHCARQKLKDSLKVYGEMFGEKIAS
ncbi:MAG: RNA polymerase sigma factor [Bacteroidia bacterium]